MARSDCNNLGNTQAGKPGCVSRSVSRFARLAAIALGLLLPAFAAQAAFISNTAAASYQSGAGGQPVTQNSNTVELNCPSCNSMQPSPAVVIFYQHAPNGGMERELPADGAQYNNGGNGEYEDLPPPNDVYGNPTDNGRPQPVRETGLYHAGEPFFVSVTDANRNQDASVREFVELTLTSCAGDTEILRLMETGPATGEFAGAIQSAGPGEPMVPYNGRLSVRENCQVTARYQDPLFPEDAAADAALVDPFGVVFDSGSGQWVDGATVTLINADTGQPAVVFGDDGISAYPATVTSGGSVTDSGGNSYNFPPGGFRFPFVSPGNYRLVVAPPAAFTAPSEASLAALQALRDPNGNPFAVGAGSFADVFVINPGPALHIDIPVDPQTSTLFLQKAASTTEVSAGDFLQYRLTLQNRDPVNAANSVVITDTLPKGLRYQAGSLRVGGAAAPDPAVSGDGRTLGINVGSVPAATTVTISYVVQVVTRQAAREAVNRAQATGAGGLVSNMAQAAVRIREPFFSDAFVLIGRVIVGECGESPAARNGLENARLMLDDGTYVTTDRDGLYHFEGVRPGTHVVQLDLDSLPPGYEAVPCIRNSRFAGRSYSQFVDVGGGGLWRADFHVRRKPGADPVAADSLPPGMHERMRRRLAIPDDATAAGGQTDWLEGATPGVEWLFPGPQHNPRAPSIRAVIKHAPDQTVSLMLNDAPVHSVSFEGTQLSKDKRIAVSQWRSLNLKEGDNRLKAEIADARGRPVQTLERVVRFSGKPVSAELVPEESILVADGVRKPVLAVRFRDRQGHPVRAGMSGGYQLNRQYLSADQVERLRQQPLNPLEPSSPQFVVEGDDGIAYIELQPTTETGMAVLTFNFQDERRERRQELRAWLKPQPRDWVVVGFARGTVGHSELEEKSRPLPPGAEDGSFTDGQASFYAKGQVQGQWLLTLAYDSDKHSVQREESLLSTIDPDEYYTLYGDGAEQRYDAASQDKLYLKLEREQFYALFGDYETGLTETQLSRYSRTLNGLKSEFAGERYSHVLFAAETSQDFARDEIAGDGTSGLYRLSSGGILINSEKVRIETRDRFRSELILSSRFMARHIDYDIDYSAGTLFFKQPVPSRDTNFNPVFIVAEYETQGGGKTEPSGGGRMALNWLGGRLTTGVSYLHEEESLGKTDLWGTDARLKVGAASELRLELAGSDSERSSVRQDGTAWLAEYEHRDEKLDALAYARRQEPGFGLNQQNGSESGMSKLGVDGQYHLSEQWSLLGQAYQQENLASDATRRVLGARGQRSDEITTLSAGFQLARDEAVTGQTFESRQLTLDASRYFLDKRLELQALADLSLGGKNDSADFPSRLGLGAAYRLTGNTRLILAQEFTDGEALDTRMTRVGVETEAWKGARFTGSLNQGTISEYGPRTFAELGIAQSLQLAERWTADLSLDTSRSLNASGAPPLDVNPSQPPAFGSTGSNPTEDYWALSGGLGYRAELWNWNGRAEARNGDVSDRYGFSSSFLRQADAGIAFSASGRLFRTEQATGTQGLYAQGDLAWAWRPLGSQWSLLDRLELRYDDLEDGTGIPGSQLFGADGLNVVGDASRRRLVNNFNLNHVSRPWTMRDRRGNLFVSEQRAQWSLYYGAKYAIDRFDDQEFKGYTDLLGLEWRHDLAPRWDVGLQASTLHSWEADTWEYSLGPQLGWSPFDNAWITLGYNLMGFRDDDFDGAENRTQGPYLALRFKFDQDTLGSGGGPGGMGEWGTGIHAAQGGEP